MGQAIRRLQTAAAVGADAAFIEGSKTKALLEGIVGLQSPLSVIPGGRTPSFTTKAAEQMGVKIIVISLVSCVAAVHGICEEMSLLKRTSTDHASAKGMDQRKFSKLLGWRSTGARIK
ncbi:hypothetical protein FRC10_001049 [Ceratobasidium sp. 414]|nr:hypothetical protein FRC10_001049 [Ceratobasidium sp. 414]